MSLDESRCILKRSFATAWAETPFHTDEGLLTSSQTADSNDHENIDRMLYTLDIFGDYGFEGDFEIDDAGCHTLPTFAHAPQVLGKSEPSFDSSLDMTDTGGTDSDFSTSEICDTCVDEHCLSSDDSAAVSHDLARVPLPKGYVSAFNYFVVNERPRVLLQHPHLKCENNTLNKVLGDEWKRLSKVQRCEYENSANEDKKRYLREVALYNAVSPDKIVPRINPPPGYDISGNSLHADRPLKKRRCDISISSSVKRPLTAYSTFAQQEKQFILGLECNEIQRRMGRYFGIRWHQMDSEEKELYALLEAVHRQESTAS